MEINPQFIDEIEKQCKRIILSLLETHTQKKGAIFVIGCSTSEIAGGKIGTESNEIIGNIIFNSAYKVLKENNIFLAAQCCEHLNRALVIESECAEKYGYEEVSVVPWVKGGGAFATAAYKGMKNSVVVENVSASAGIDIGLTLIGMHLKQVAVPFRLEKPMIGNALVSAAYSRPKLIGGERAVYK